MGKPYTMRELKKIVDYLVEHRYYGEIRGRKMWMDFESTRTVNRTWQSLKETFLKRILPDIHNPYFNLSVQELESFRKETDVTGKTKNKLETVTITNSSSDNAEHERVKQPSTSKAIPENERPGEDNLQCGKVSSRTISSTDTLVLENCGAANEDAADELDTGTKRSFRDLITYSEPLTPMLQEVLHDFDSDDDPPMQIVEEDEVVIERPKSRSPFEIRQSRSMKNDAKKSPAKSDTNKERNKSPAKIKSLKLKKTHKGTWEKGSGNITDNASMKDSKEQNKKPALKKRSTKSVDVIPKELEGKGNTSATHKRKSSINCSSTSADTQIPNNQEALKSSKSALTSKNQDGNAAKTNGDLKRRSHTPERGSKNKRTKSNSVDTNSEVQIIKDSEPTVISIADTASQHDSSKENVPETKNNQEQNKSNKHKPNDKPKATDVIEVSEESNTEGNVLNEAGSSVEIGNTPAEINPCLNSVSLFAEQFSTEKYSGAESDEDAIKSKAKNVEDNLKKQNITEEAKNKPTEKANNDKAEKNDIPKEKSIEKEKLKTNEGEKEVNIILEATDKKQEEVPAENQANENAADSVSRNSTDSDFEQPKQKHAERRIYDTKTRDKALADVFGFSSGGVRKRSISNRDKNKRIHKNHGKRRSSTAREARSSYASSSSDSDDSESPRKHRHHKNYIPKSYPILKKDGALFVADGETLYPLVLRDKKSANFVELLESDEEQDVSYWQKKCAQEKMRADKLARQAAEQKIRADELARKLERQKRPSKSPILQLNPVLNSTATPSTSKQNQKEPKQNQSGEKMKVKTDFNNQEQAVKMKVSKNSKNDVGIEIECRFEHLDHVYEHVFEKLAKTLHMDASEAKKDAPPETVITIESERSSPAAEKVNKIEREIFEEIEQRSKIEEKKAFSDSNVTKRKRRGRPPKEPRSSSLSDVSIAVTKRSRARSVGPGRETKRAGSAAPKSPAKSPRAKTKRAGTPKSPAKSPRAPSKGRITESKQAGAAVPIPRARSARSLSIGRSPETRRAAAPKSPAKSDIMPTRTRRAPRRLEEEITVKRRGRSVSKTNVDIPEDDSRVRYKFPDSRSSSRSRTSNKREKRNTTRSRRDHKLWSSPESNSIESSLGYQDSDDSFESTALRRRRKYPSSQFYRRHPTRNECRRKSYPYLADDDTCETVPNRSGSAQNGSLNTDVYRSESYQLLGVNNQIGFVSVNQTNNNSDKAGLTGFKNTSNVETFNVHIDNVSATLRVDGSCSSRTEDGNSSNVSFPLSMSPVLPVAGNISVTKEVLERVEEQPTLNETHGNDATEPVSDYNKYMISEIDVSLPLMGQDCELHEEKQSFIDTPDTENDIISESLLGKICTVDLKEQSSSDSLAVKLRNMLLESAKKIAQKKQGENDPDKENAMEVDATVKKVRKPRANKKRCSTPRKKVSKTTSEGAILEEHLESCSYSGRKSCPPAIKIIACENVCDIDEGDNNNAVLGAVNTNRRGKKKKDVIKVKITRPSKEKRSLSKKETLQSSRKSVCTDSGINDESFLQCCNDDSIELIHNHSETCLQTHECLGDSIEFIQNKSKSIISVDSDSMSCENAEGNSIGDRELLSEFFCDNAQDVARLNVRHGPVEGSNSTPYFTPPSHDSPNSLITEDLSVEIASDIRPDRTSKWYLCSDDESTLPGEEAAAAGVGANLKQIFTVVCAVPNLSTISETSRENDSRKPTLDAENE